MTIDDLSAKLDVGFAKIDARFKSLEEKVEDGFNGSLARDEELRDLTKFGLEAREILRGEINRRFDDADRKTELQITLLKDAVEYLNKRG